MAQTSRIKRVDYIGIRVCNRAASQRCRRPVAAAKPWRDRAGTQTPHGGALLHTV
jgi:hypothetical protein